MAASIRPAQVSDAGEIAKLTRQLGYELSAPDAAVRLSRILPRRDQEFLIAEVDGQPVGWVQAVIADYVDAEMFGVISGLVVDSHCRRQGIGRMLVEHAEAWIRQQGCSVVRLWSSSTRSPSHRFYEHIGYTKIKTQFSFAKSLEAGHESLERFVPRVAEED